MSETILEARQLIGGWKGGEDSAPNLNPSDGSEIGRIAMGSVDDVDIAVELASSTARKWAKTPAGERAGILNRAADILAADAGNWAVTMATEMGKPITEAKMECMRAAAILRYFAEELHRPIGDHFLSDVGATWLFTRREPLGVVALITPWNFPAAIPAWKLAPALAFGNTVVMKLASDAPATGLRLAEALVEAGLPEGVLNVVLGSGSKLGTRLIEHPDVKAISFTGSNQVGRQIIEQGAANLKKVQAEMGGHNPAIVFADANLDATISALAAGGFASAGQKCTATRRVFVERSSYDEVAERLAEAANRLKVGPAIEPNTTLGPLAGQSQLQDVQAAVTRAGEAGTLLAGGGFPEEAPGGGSYLSATVISGLSKDSEFATQEVFGPALAVWPIDDEEEAVELANETSYGLSASIFTSDLDRAKRFVEEIQVGLVHVNSQTAGAEVHVPFGGLKQSSFGPHEQGRSAIEFYTQDKTVYLDGSGA